jgi:hypothetical protein
MRLATFRAATLAVTLATAAACGSDSTASPLPSPKDPATAPRVSVDRFSATAGMLFVRSATNGLPAANAPIDMDTGPFITTGLGPAGEHIKYYNFDVQPTAPAPIFVLFRAGQTTPVEGQLNVVDVVPGQSGYNDFWQVMKVTVPANYVANSITSVDEIRTGGFAVEPTTIVVNCPIVPEGSIARLHGGPSAGLTHGWYRGQVVAYFNFDEAPITTTAAGAVPLAAIYVTFTTNPNQPGGGPASGFKTEQGSLQTHNVVAALPGKAGYTPLWTVDVYDNSAFTTVKNLTTAAQSPQLGAAGNVNCPIVSVEP